MLRISLKIAIRNFLKNKGFFLINLIGLTLGLSISLIVLATVNYELNYDSFNRQYNRIFEYQQRMYFEQENGLESYVTDRSGGAIGPELTNHFPEIESFVRFGSLNGEVLLSYIPPNDSLHRVNIIEKNGKAADSTVFDVFTFPFIKGNPSRALYLKNSIVLTEKTAKKYFGEEDPLGKTILVNETIPLTVTGIIQNVPLNSNLKFDFLVPFSLLTDFDYNIDGFEGNPFTTFLLIRENADVNILNEKIAGYLKSVYDSKIRYDPFLTPLKQVHLKGENRGYITVYSFSAIALIILLTACINFINLTTARSFDRLKEVGIRKTAGAGRKQLMLQFLTETFVLTAISFFLAIIITELAIPVLNKSANLNITLNLTGLKFIISICTLIVITGLLSGLYPAFILSSFNPVHSLKNVRKSSKSGTRLRKILVISQFVISIFAILCTVIIVIQLNYILSADPGFDRNNMIIVPVRGHMSNKLSKVEHELDNSNVIEAVSSASEIPDNVNIGEFDWGRADHENNTMIARTLYVDYDFAYTFRIPMKAGRFYSRDFAGDSINSMVINQAVADHLGYENPVGEPFYLFGRKFTIIGVIKDFNFFPLNLGGKAICLPFSHNNPFLFVRYKAGNLKAAINKIVSICEQENPNYPPEYYLFNDYKKLANRLSNSSRIILIAITPLGLLISCLGLVGLSIFTAEVKTKEIGIRKTFGASIYNILFGFFKEFIILIFIAMIISMPLSHLMMNFVLNFFSPRVSISPFLYILIALLLFLLTFLVTGWHAFRAARKNPVLSLRYE